MAATRERKYFLLRVKIQQIKKNFETVICMTTGKGETFSTAVVFIFFDRKIFIKAASDKLYASSRLVKRFYKSRSINL